MSIARDFPDRFARKPRAEDYPDDIKTDVERIAYSRGFMAGVKAANPAIGRVL